MKRPLVISVGTAWLALVGVGLAFLASYAATPGESAKTVKIWPAISRLDRPAHRDLLLMFVHPQCPCSQAGMEEINRVMARCTGKVAVEVVFVKPTQMSQDWEKTALWKSAAAMPDVKLVTDAGGVEADLFGAETSGQTFLFSPQGTLMFSGGITAGRGHAGDNAGTDAICLLVNGVGSSLRNTPVFGCSLGDPARKGKCPQ